MRLMILAAGVTCLAGCTTAAGPQLVSRIGPQESPLAVSVGVPASAELVYVSGSVPDAVDSAAPAGSVERFGDTETQTRSVLNKLDAALAERGMSLADVVMMRVFLVAPSGQPRMDFAGMMRAYRERFGTAQQPNKPARSTMQVAGLVDPGWLVEIEVTAARSGQGKAALNSRQ
jgi:enamine deaminase RidA (YjgF/YER057c/UK114 family)